jgi:cysteine synthase
MMELKRTNLARELLNRPDIVDFLNSERCISQIFDVENNLSTDRIEFYKKIYNGIGNTPSYIVNLPNNNTLYIKAEYFNSMGNNHYSRFWVPYLFLCEMLNIIIPGNTKVIEVTSGSSGISLSMACKLLGFDLTIVIPESLPKGRKDPMLENNAKLIPVNGYIDCCITKLHEIIKTDDFFAANHSDEKSNLITHIFKRMAIEHYRDFGIPDYCFLGLGNGSSTFSVGNYFKNIKPEMKVISYHSDISNNQIVLGLLPPNIPVGLLKHVKPARLISDEINIISNSINKDVLDYFKFDSEIISLGESSILGVSLAYKLSLMVFDSKFFVIGFDKSYRYYE